MELEEAQEIVKQDQLAALDKTGDVEKPNPAQVAIAQSIVAGTRLPGKVTENPLHPGQAVTPEEHAAISADVASAETPKDLAKLKAKHDKGPFVGHPLRTKVAKSAPPASVTKARAVKAAKVKKANREAAKRR